MFAQFFGGYLFNHKLCTAEDLTQAFEAKKHTRLRLGVLAINAGLMTAEQVEHVNITQQSVDKRFGDLAVELGYVTADDVEKLLAQQPTDYLLLGQTLVNNGALTNAEFEKALKDYKAENQITDDISDNQTETLHNLINEFYHFDNDENARICTDYVTLLFKNLIRFIGDDFTPMEASVIKNFAAEHIVIQKINGKYIVLLKIPRVELGVDELNNILCYDEQGIMCWQISNKLPSNIVSKEQIPYIAIQVIDGKLYATDFWGRKFNVDTENGELIDVKIVH